MTNAFSRRLDKVAELLDEAWENGFDAGYQAGIEDQGDEYADWDISDEELDAYQAERTYDEAYYDPFTRDIDWRLFR